MHTDKVTKLIIWEALVYVDYGDFHINLEVLSGDLKDIQEKIKKHYPTYSETSRKFGDIKVSYFAQIICEDGFNTQYLGTDPIDKVLKETNKDTRSEE